MAASCDDLCKVGERKRRAAAASRLSVQLPHTPFTMFEGQSLLVIGGKSLPLSSRLSHPGDLTQRPTRTGEGFLGHRLIELLLERYPKASVASLDVVQRHFPDSKQWTFYSADLTSLDSLSNAFKQHAPTVVFHTASPWTGSGKEVCEKVNVDGTRTVVEACVQQGVERLVFTSSAGTVYDGIDLVNVDERMPFPTDPLDAYNETKVSCSAERRALSFAAN